jgi:hypothetical protein
VQYPDKFAVIPPAYVFVETLGYVPARYKDLVPRESTPPLLPRNQGATQASPEPEAGIKAEAQSGADTAATAGADPVGEGDDRAGGARVEGDRRPMLVPVKEEMDTAGDAGPDMEA